MVTIAVASDHGAFKLKNTLVEFLKTLGINAIDLGTHSETESVDFPDFSDRVVHAIKTKQADLGILCCGTGIGVSIRANRYTGIRAALIHDAFTAEMAKAHSNANILCLGGRTIPSLEDACNWVKIWLDTTYEGGRHQRRLDKLDAPTDNQPS